MTVKRTPLAALLMIAVGLTGLAGCGGGQLNVGSAEAKLPAGENSAMFLDRISSLTSVSENDAMRGLCLLLNGKDEAETFRQRVTTLNQQGVVPASWDLSADRPIAKGKLAYMIYQACKLTGGATLTLLGPSQWYCLRELQYQGFMSPGPVYGEVSGMEFVAVIGRADAYLETGEVPAVIRAGN